MNIEKKNHFPAAFDKKYKQVKANWVLLEYDEK